MKSIIHHWALLLRCLTGITPANTDDTPSLSVGGDAPKPAHHQLSLKGSHIVQKP